MHYTTFITVLTAPVIWDPHHYPGDFKDFAF
jgi:hypothetical protein